MGYKCDRCGHEWIPRQSNESEPRVCPRCHSAYWNRPRRRSATSYEDFRDKVRATLQGARRPMTWTEIRTTAGLPQMFPNNQWVHRMEKDIGLGREKDQKGIIHWTLK